MTGVSLFLLGTVALSNIAFLAYLLLDRNTRLKPPAAKPPEDRPEASGPTKPEKVPQPRSFVGKSKFNIDDEIESRIDRIVDKAFDRNIRRVSKAMMGDVRFSDVEFADIDEAPAVHAPNPEHPASEQWPKSARMTPEQETASFEDVRIEDVEPDTVSPPSASGATMDEIAESVGTAANPDATTEDKVKAAKVLTPLMDTNLMDNLLSYEEIYKGVQGCMTELLRADIADKEANRIHKPVPVKSEPVPSSAPTAESRTFKIAKSIDDFDPADLLK